MQKSVLITGGTRGIGEGVVRKFYAAGWRTAFCYRQSGERAEALCREMPGLLAVQADVTNEGDVARMVEEVRRVFGKTDALVCSAGIGHYGLLQDVTPEEYDALYKVNVRGVYLCCRAVLPEMIRRQSGSIVTVCELMEMPRTRATLSGPAFSVISLKMERALSHHSSAFCSTMFGPGKIR